MKFYAISGSRRTVDEVVEKDVTEVVSNILKEGDGIVSGGALGVDYIATQLALTLGDPQKQLKLFLPIKLERFCTHYQNRANEGVISQDQAKIIITQLQAIAQAAPQAIHDTTPFELANEESYYARNTSIIQAADELYAFHVNNSQGTQDAIDQATSLGKPTTVKKYTLPKKS